MTERNRVEIDYCPQCRGVWLDRGELDKIIESSALRDSPEEHRTQRPGEQGGYDRKRKRKSFLGEMFDF
ncbi:MAG: zf-TFIIB domain-containing protein [Bacillota bacterium]|jgi:Zn-finger nucleic acid-binding protein|nr:zf-TFIIB domain-containing protein [Bacillota bacterium]